jgi:serine/threonine protein kinase
MATLFMLGRFRHERQILASLKHPHIARLLEGGTTEEGFPYLVMEYIEGQPITDYCASNKLSTKQRLNLFRFVCEAVQYAHKNLVIHRDLKPSNILVTEGCVPKLLDFGIAKLLSPELSPGAVAVAQTMATGRLMTPHYASPEQVRGETMTTATDIYSLGAVLYEMLTGERPHRFKNQSVAEIERVVCQTDVERPSAVVERLPNAPARLRRELAGDLDNIVLMAMRKEPERRYQSVDQLSEDVRRHLKGRAVKARQDTLGYRASKFVRRHRARVIMKPQSRSTARRSP